MRDPDPFIEIHIYLNLMLSSYGACNEVLICDGASQEHR